MIVNNLLKFICNSLTVSVALYMICWPEARAVNITNSLTSESIVSKAQNLKLTDLNQFHTITNLNISHGYMEFNRITKDLEISAQQKLNLQWQSFSNNVAYGRIQIRNKTAGGTTVAHKYFPAQSGAGYVNWIELSKDLFLSPKQPQSDTTYEIQITPYNSSFNVVGLNSNNVYVKHLSKESSHIGFGPVRYARFPQVEILSTDEKLLYSQQYITPTSIELKISNPSNNVTDSFNLTVGDNSLLYNPSTIVLPSLMPGSSMTKTVELPARLINTNHQLYSSIINDWKERHYQYCGPEFRATMNWKGHQNDSPINHTREIILPMEGWGEYTNVSRHTPICDGNDCLNLCEMEKSLHKRLDNNVVGYSFVIGSGSPVMGAGGKARIGMFSGSEDDIEVDFTSKTSVSAGSVAKLITAIAAVKIAGDNTTATIDSPAGMFYPANWNTSNYFGNVTLSAFLAQSSGIKGYGNVPMTYEQLQQFFEQPVTGNWNNAMCTGPNVVNPPMAVNISNQTRCYSNYNFGIFRMLLPAMAGLMPDSNLLTRPTTLANQYEQLVRQNVFEPVGQFDTGCRPRSTNPDAYSYNFPGTSPGGNWGDERMVCGASSWNLSTEDMAKVLFSLNNSDERILTQTQYQTLANRGLGLDIINQSQLEKNGAWGNISSSASIYGPTTGPNVVATLFINSNIGSGPNTGQSARAVLTAAYNEAQYTK